MVNPYELFLLGELPFADFAEVVAADYSFSLGDTQRETTSHRAVPPVIVLVREKNLVPMLRRFLEGGVSADEVSVWAFVIATVDAFDLSALPQETAEALASLSFAPVATYVTPEVVEAVLHLCERSE